MVELTGSGRATWTSSSSKRAVAKVVNNSEGAIRGTVLPGTGSKLESRRVTRVKAGRATGQHHRQQRYRELVYVQQFGHALNDNNCALYVSTNESVRDTFIFVGRMPRPEATTDQISDFVWTQA